MLARTLLDEHYHDLRSLTLAVADALAAQASRLDCACVQVDEANIPGNPADGPLAADAINRVFVGVRAKKAVHFCFGNYGGQTIQRGTWTALLSFLNSLDAESSDPRIGAPSVVGPRRAARSGSADRHWYRRY
jgi:5-methyltetrahydropteroyltriglutamate--homocysteine methyltransferase